MTNKDKAEVMKLIADAKRELRAEFNDFSNRNFEDKQTLANNILDNMDAILELGDIVGGE